VGPGDHLRFLREAELLAKVDHPCILKLRYLIVTPPSDLNSGEIKLLSDYYPKGSLSDWLDRNKHANYPTSHATQKLFILVGIAAGMRYLHHRRIRHRDLTASNVLLSEGPGFLRPVICDFGLSKAASGTESLGLTQGGIGAPSYRAPELGTKDGYSWPVDYYSFGRLCYRVITGKSESKWPKGHLDKWRSFVADAPENWREIIGDLGDRISTKRPTFSRFLYEIGRGKLMLDGADAALVLAYMRELGVDQVNPYEQVSKLPSDWVQLQLWCPGTTHNRTLTCRPDTSIRNAQKEYAKSMGLFSSQVAFAMDNKLIGEDAIVCGFQDCAICLKVAPIVREFVCGEITIPVLCNPFLTVRTAFLGNEELNWRGVAHCFPSSVDFTFFDANGDWIDPTQNVIDLGQTRRVIVAASWPCHVFLPNESEMTISLSYWMRVIEMRQMFESSTFGRHLQVFDSNGNPSPNTAFLWELSDHVTLSVEGSPSIVVLIDGVYELLDSHTPIDQLKKDNSLIWLKGNDLILKGNMKLSDVSDCYLTGSRGGECIRIEVGELFHFELSLPLTGLKARSILSSTFLHLPIEQIDLQQSNVSVEADDELVSNCTYRVADPGRIRLTILGFCRNTTLECGLFWSVAEVSQRLNNLFQSVPDFLLAYNGFVIDQWRPLCFSGIASDCTIFAILPSRLSCGIGQYCFETPDSRLLRRDFPGGTPLVTLREHFARDIGTSDIGFSLEGEELSLTETLDNLHETIEKDDSHTIRIFLTLPRVTRST
jgi:serine/threonine protein kinase